MASKECLVKLCSDSSISIKYHCPLYFVLVQIQEIQLISSCFGSFEQSRRVDQEPKRQLLIHGIAVNHAYAF